MITFSSSCLAIVDFVGCCTSSCPDLMADSECTPPPLKTLKRKPWPSHFDDSCIMIFIVISRCLYSIFFHATHFEGYGNLT